MNDAQTTQMKRFGSLLLAVGALLGCAQQGEPLPAPTPATIQSFTASAEEVSPGGKVTLQWEVSDATEVTLTQVGVGPVPGVDGRSSGSVEVALNGSTSFLLSAVGAGGSDTVARFVRVQGGEAKVLFSAVPGEVTAGESATLVWNAGAASSVSLTAGTAPLDIANKASGTLSVSPRAETTYTLTVDGASFTTTVSVTPAILELTSSADSVEDGQPITLRWKTGGGTKLTVSRAGAGVVHEAAPAEVAEGSWEDAAPAPAGVFDGVVTYELTLQSEGQAASRKLELAVGVSPRITRFEVPPYAAENDRFTVSWATSNADTVRLYVGSDVVFATLTEAQAKSGSLSLASPASAADVRLMATNSRGGSSSQQRPVTPIGPVAVTDFQASVASVASAGTPVTLSWSVMNAAIIKIEEERGTTRTLVFAGDASQGSSLQVFPSETVRYVLTADNTVGSTEESALKPQVEVLSTGALSFAHAQLPEGAMTQVTGHNVTGGSAVFGLPTLAHDAPGEAWVDISSVGTALPAVAGNDSTAFLAQLPVPFSTLLYGMNVEGARVSVSVNGWFKFSDTTVTGTNSHTTSNKLPSSSLEPLAIAPFWDNLVFGEDSGMYFHLEGTGLQRRLIVQWDNMRISATGFEDSRLSFQAQVYATGRIVFAYHRVDGLQTRVPSIGVVDASESTAVMLVSDTGAPAAGQTKTFFGEATLPLQVRAVPGARASVQVGTDDFTQVRAAPAVLPAGKLLITEANVSPAAGITDGEWFEVLNAHTEAVDLQGWTLTFSGGSTHVVSSALVVPAGGHVLLGQSLTGGDGLTVDYSYGTGFALGASGPLQLGVEGVLDFASAAWSGVVAGTAVQLEPLRPSDEATYSSGLGQMSCPATQAYGSGQKGTPGQPNARCLPYDLTKVTGVTPSPFESLLPSGVPLPGATALVFANGTEAATALTLTRPIKLFGEEVTELTVGVNGWIAPRAVTCPSATSCHLSNRTTPNATGTEPFGFIAPFWDNLSDNGTSAPNGVYWLEKDPDGVPGNADDVTIISWENWKFQTTSTTVTSSLNFQVKFFGNGDIELAYGTMTASNSTTLPKGSSATAWLERPDGRAALKANVNSSSPGIAPDSAYRFVYAP